MPIRPIKVVSATDRQPDAAPTASELAPVVQQAAPYPVTVEPVMTDTTETATDLVAELAVEDSFDIVDEDSETREAIEDLILAYLNLVTEPTDDQLHKLAEAAGLDYATFEEVVLSLLSAEPSFDELDGEEDIEELDDNPSDDVEDSESDDVTDDDELVSTSL